MLFVGAVLRVLSLSIRLLFHFLLQQQYFPQALTRPFPWVLRIWIVAVNVVIKYRLLDVDSISVVFENKGGDQDRPVK